MRDKENTKIILPIPENFGRAHEAEEKIRNDSIVHIAGNTELTDYQEVLQDAINLIFDISAVYKSKDENEQTLQLIGCRLFNSSLASYKLMLSGYYQVSLSIVRDILEISFLLDYFHAQNRKDGFDKSKIEFWREATRKERREKIDPAIIRELDKRNGFTERKREKNYWLFSEYASHITPKSLKLLSSAGTINIGPYFYGKNLKNSLYELTRFVVTAAINYVTLFRNLPRGFIGGRQIFNQRFEKWKKYLKPYDVKILERLLQ
jgi:hypothetical protein